MENEIVGYGDTECSESCPMRNQSVMMCDFMAEFTRLQIENAGLGDMANSYMYEGKQNQCAISLGCEPGRRRM